MQPRSSAAWQRTAHIGVVLEGMRKKNDKRSSPTCWRAPRRETSPYLVITGWSAAPAGAHPRAHLDALPSTCTAAATLRVTKEQPLRPGCARQSASFGRAAPRRGGSGSSASSRRGRGGCAAATQSASADAAFATAALPRRRGESLDRDHQHPSPPIPSACLPGNRIATRRRDGSLSENARSSGFVAFAERTRRCWWR
jgi:hypothetical protein